jgi:hypothetical protein
VTLAAGNLTLWRPFIHPAGLVELQNQGTLTLLGAAQIGRLAMPQGRLVANGDVEIGTFDALQFASFRAASRIRITGNASLVKGFEATGPGLVEFLGTTTLADNASGTSVQVGNATVRNRGTWRYPGWHR